MSQATFATHEVFNQSPPFEDIDLYALDRPLVEAVAANGGACGAGRVVGVRQALGLGGDGGSAAASPTRTRRNCAPSIPEATAATRSNFIRPITS